MIIASILADCLIPGGIYAGTSALHLSIYQEAPRGPVLFGRDVLPPVAAVQIA
jgi:hypothetical protein